MIEQKIDVKRAVTDKRTVTFAYYRDDALWYYTEHSELFSVPIDDAKGATFLAEDKAILFMRWMNKWNAELEC